MTPTATSTRRWYQYRGPWLIMAGPAVVVVASLFTAWLAYRNQDDLVDANYYQSGQSVNRILKTNRYAQQYHLGAQLRFNPVTGQIDVNLDQCPGGQCPPTLQLQLRHPARAQYDRSVTLALDSGSHYRANATLPPAHRWYLALGDGEQVWRIGAVWDPLKPQGVRLHPLQSVNPEDQ